MKYLNIIVEQDHRSVKRITNSMLGFKSFDSASITLSGLEIVHTLRKGQLATQDISVQSFSGNLLLVGSIVELGACLRQALFSQLIVKRK